MHCYKPHTGKRKKTILPHPLPYLSSLSLTVYRANAQRKGLPLQRGCHSQTLTLSPSRSIQIFTTSSPHPTSHPSTHLFTPHSPTIISPPSLHHHYNSNRTNDNHHNKNNITTLNPTLKKKVRYSRKTYLPSQGLKIPDFGDDIAFTSGARTRRTQSIGKVLRLVYSQVRISFVFSANPYSSHTPSPQSPITPLLETSRDKNKKN